MFLISQRTTNSPLTNKRTDEFGGEIAGRIKIHIEIIKAVRDATSYDFPILLRLGGCDYMEGGITIEDSMVASIAFEKAGVDILDISGGFCGYIIPGNTSQGYFAPITLAIKEVVKIPVLLTGGITQVPAAQKLLADGKADLIGVARAIYEDSKWAENAIKSIK